MTDCLPSNTPLEETGFGYTLSLINGKYKMIIMYWLYEKNVMRFNEMQRCIGNISFRTLSNTLKELERDGLSERGQSLIPLLDMMCQWGEQNKPS